MPLDDLDLEFEDEEEAKRKKNEAVQQDVDLDFTATPDQQRVAARPAARPGMPATPPQQTRPGMARPPMGEVKKLDDVRTAAAAKKPVAPAPPAASSAPRSVGSSALAQEPAYDLESEQHVMYQEEIRRIQLEADVKVAVAEFKSELMIELLSDMKLMDHQIGQLLNRINAKHPDMKQEALMIKKILADFTAKKRK